MNKIILTLAVIFIAGCAEVSDRGMETMMGNVGGRLNLDIKNKEDVDTLIILLEGQ